jgi:hypothetical protein
MLLQVAFLQCATRCCLEKGLRIYQWAWMPSAGRKCVLQSLWSAGNDVTARYTMFSLSFFPRSIDEHKKCRLIRILMYSATTMQNTEMQKKRVVVVVVLVTQWTVDA